MDPAHHPDSANSSPRSRPDAAACWDDQHPAKLRLMCSFGGHIVPRPHDRSLCYVGGDTRIVVLDRLSSMADLHSRLSHTLLNGRPFTLKYQLPTEELDSLISLATDEDLDNMIDEYDRTASASASSPLKPSRLRLFLFPSKPETAASMGSLLDDAKSETWLVDVLNGAGLLPRGLSDSAAMDDTFLELDRGLMVNRDPCPDLDRGLMVNRDPCPDLDHPKLLQDQQAVLSADGSTIYNPQLEASALDSPPQVETSSSSFGSSSSSPSMANLPPIKVRVESYQAAGLDEQFSNMSIAPPNLANAAPPYVTVAAPKSGGSEALNRVNLHDDDQKSEKFDHGIVAPTNALRKPPLPLLPVPRKLVDLQNLPSPDSKHAGCYNLASPDSAASDCSIASAGSLSKSTIYQDATQVRSRENRGPSPVATDHQKISSNIQEAATSHQVPMQQYMESVSTPALQNPQQQPFHPTGTTHYVPHPAVSMPSYYPMYLQQPNQALLSDPHPQYPPMYLLPPHQPPCCDHHPMTSMPMPSRPLTPPPNNAVPYTESIYTTKPEMAGNLYPASTGTGVGVATSVLVQVPASAAAPAPHQYQQHQYIGGISQIPPPAAQSNIAAAAYGYEYPHHMQMQLDHQAYYGQQHMAAAAFPSSAAPPPQHQTTTPAAAAMFSQAASSTHQLPPPDSTTAATINAVTSQQSC